MCAAGDCSHPRVLCPCGASGGAAGPHACLLAVSLLDAAHARGSALLSMHFQGCGCAGCFGTLWLFVVVWQVIVASAVLPAFLPPYFVKGL